MKKVFTDPHFKVFNKARARKSLRRRLAFKAYRKQKNISELGLPKVRVKHKREYDDKTKSYTHVKAPNNFTFIGNPEETISFINKLKDCYDNSKKAFVVLKDVRTIDYDAVVVLLSIMVRFKAKKVSFNGDFPDDTTAKNVIHESGFFLNLNKYFKDEERYYVKNKNWNTIYTHAWKNVDAALGARIIEDAAKTIWNEKRRCQGAQRTLLELMQNTNNHAAFGKEGEKHWWISVNHRAKERKVCFSFVDYGVGVFESLSQKQEGNKFFQALDKMYEKFKYGGNEDLLPLILSGELHKTVTREHYRGKGLPGVAEALKRKQISNLHIITNDVYCNVDKGEYKKLSNKFSGTFIYWELDQNSASCNAD